MITWWTGAAYRVGLGAREGAQWMVHANVPKVHGKARISSEYLDLAEFLGLPCEDFRMALHPSGAAVARAQQCLEDHGVRGSFAAICPFTTRPQKHWIESHWVEWINLWWQKTGMPCLVLGGPADGEAADRICAAVSDPLSVVNLSGSRFLKVAEAAALIGRAAILAGVDTGMTHMGIAMGRPTLCLFGSTVPYTITDRPEVPVRILFERMDCAPCRKHPTCGGAYHCMRQLSPGRALEAALELLGGVSRGAAVSGDGTSDTPVI
jgi:heptosyltransferase-1